MQPLFARYQQRIRNRQCSGDATTDMLVTLLRAQLDDLRQDRDAQVANLREERDRWHAAYLALQRQLPAPATAPAAVDNRSRNRWRQRFWRFMWAYRMGDGASRTGDCESRTCTA